MSIGCFYNENINVNFSISGSAVKFVKFLKNTQINYGVHFPFLKLEEWKNLKKHYTEKNILFKLYEHTLCLASHYKASYVTIHFPECMLGISSLEAFYNSIREYASFLNELKNRYNVPIYLEINPSTYYPFSRDFNLFISIAEEYKDLSYCLDVGAIFYNASLLRFNAEEFIKNILSYVSSLHLSDTNMDIPQREHIPLHPIQLKDPKLWNIPKSLEYILPNLRENCIAVFEYNSLSDFPFSFVKEGISWVKSLAKGEKERLMSQKDINIFRCF